MQEMTEPSDDTAAMLEPDGRLEQDFLRHVGEETRRHFPRTFAEAELVLIDVDPNHLHAFWNIPLAALHAARSRPEAADAPMVLRLFALNEAETFTDTEVGGLQGRTYVSVWGGPRRHRAILGLRATDGSLVELASSNEVELPSGGPAPDPVGHDAGEQATGARADPFAPLFNLEAVMPVSSYVLAGDKVAFEAVAELHLHGRAEPGGTVRLFGRDIPLRPDGSFSLVRVLPNDARLLSALLAGEREDTDKTGGSA